MGPRYGEYNVRGERYEGPTTKSRKVTAGVGVASGTAGVAALSQVPKANRRHVKQLGKVGAANAESKLVGGEYLKQHAAYSQKEDAYKKAAKVNRKSSKKYLPDKGVKPAVPHAYADAVKRRGAHEVKAQAFKLRSRNLKIAGAVGLVGAGLAGVKASEGLKRSDFKLPKRPERFKRKEKAPAVEPVKADPIVREVKNPDGTFTHKVVTPDEVKAARKRLGQATPDEIKAARKRLRQVDRDRLDAAG